MQVKELQAIAKKIRVNTIKSIYNAGSGHPGSSLSCVDLLTMIYFDEFKEHDRVVLSKGHAAPALYATFAEKGWIKQSELMTLRKIDSRLQGHPDRTRLPCLDAGTGALGQGLSIAAGYALAAKMKGNGGRAFAIVGDGELQEGQIWEAVMSAPLLGLDNLVCIVDSNKFQNEGPCLNIGPIWEKFESFDWLPYRVNGHDINHLKTAFKFAAGHNNQPVVIIAESVKGKGVSFMENSNEWHGKVMNAQDYARALEDLK